ncbi:MAG: hypothetical protein IJJ99_00670 [Oscillospiraceae bacterium]|nr:hypothetical protein [Oscillospiraceae bacterium]
MEFVTRWYCVGNLGFCVQGPAYPEQPNMAAFRVEGGDPAQPRIRITLGEPSEATELPCVSKTKLKACYQRGSERVRIFYREDHKEGVLLRAEDHPNGDCDVTIAQDALSGLGGKLVLQLVDLPRRLLAREGVFLHASMIEADGRAILFTAKKQTGKSTQAELWRRFRGARILNGDRALLQCRNGVWHAIGSPFCGTSEYCEKAELPLAAVVQLSQAKENRVSRLPAKAAIAAFLEGCTYEPTDPVQTDAVIDLALAIYRDVPFYHLACLPDESAVVCLEKALRQSGIRSISG